jgi:beta-galactosidase
MPAALHVAKLHLDHLYDFAAIYLNGKQVGTLDRHYKQEDITLNSDGPAQLDILVENTGRLNSTKYMRDERKGMRAATLDGAPLTGWQIYPLPMESLPEKLVAVTPDALKNPHFAEGHFALRETGDTYLDVRTLGKGLIWINGHALGRFWNIGPQGTMYVPAPWLKKGRNEVTIFELLGTNASPRLAGLTTPILDSPTPGYASDPERKKKPASDAEFGPKLATPASAGPNVPKE